MPFLDKHCLSQILVQYNLGKIKKTGFAFLGKIKKTGLAFLGKIKKTGFAFLGKIKKTGFAFLGKIKKTGFVFLATGILFFLVMNARRNTCIFLLGQREINL